MTKWMLLVMLIAALINGVARAENTLVDGHLVIDGDHVIDGPNPLNMTDPSANADENGNARYDCVEFRDEARIQIYHATPDKPVEIQFKPIEDPAITQQHFALDGKISYEGLMDTAFIELAVEFADGRHVSARTQDESGPAMKLSGASPIRPFRLAMDCAPGQPPIRVSVKLFVSSPGRITLRDVFLGEPAPPVVTANTTADALLQPQPRPLTWLNEHFAVVFCVLIGLSGVAAVPMRALVRRGKGRRIVLGFFVLIAAVGIAQLFAAAVAFGANKPADVWAVLLGGGAIGTFVPLLVMADVGRQYKRFELRKMQAMDVA